MNILFLFVTQTKGKDSHHQHNQLTEESLTSFNKLQLRRGWNCILFSPGASQRRRDCEPWNVKHTRVTRTTRAAREWVQCNHRNKNDKNKCIVTRSKQADSLNHFTRSGEVVSWDEEKCSDSLVTNQYRQMDHHGIKKRAIISNGRVTRIFSSCKVHGTFAHYRYRGVSNMGGRPLSLMIKFSVPFVLMAALQKSGGKKLIPWWSQEPGKENILFEIKQTKLALDLV